jgi:signal peptidase I
VALLSMLPLSCSPASSLELVIQESSMEPTISAGEVVRFQAATEARQGQVIAFEYPFRYPGKPRRELIARVIGLPGDRLELGPNGIVVNDAPLVEPYTKNQQRVSPGRFSVPPGSYYVLGDDRANQRDSRSWGALPAEKLLGVADPPR